MEVTYILHDLKEKDGKLEKKRKSFHSINFASHG